MTKTITITSKKEFLNDTSEHIILGTYAYYPASNAVKVFTKAVIMFNNGLSPKKALAIGVKYTEQEKAKIKLKGPKDSVYTFINRIIAETDIMDKFDIKV